MKGPSTTEVDPGFFSTSQHVCRFELSSNIEMTHSTFLLAPRGQRQGNFNHAHFSKYPFGLCISVDMAMNEHEREYFARIPYASTVY